MTDEFHGEGGSFEIDKASGKRKRVGKPFGPSHPDGDRARDKAGEPIEAAAPKPQPALPEPAKRAPWDPEPTAEKAAPASAPKKGSAA